MMKQKRAGFTIVELMIVVAILAIIAAMAAPSFIETIERRQLNGAGEKLFADLLFAKTEAIKRNTPVRVTFVGNGATWCYGMAVNAACDCTDNLPACELDAGVPKITNQADFSNVVSVDAADSSLDDNSTSFTPLRGAANAGNIQFSITSGAEFRVIVSSFGRVRLCSDTGTFGHAVC